MWKQVSLRARVYAILFAFVFIVLGGGAVMIWYTHQMEALVARLVNHDVLSLEEIGNLLRDLDNQKVFVSYFFMDGNPEWLTKADSHPLEFRERIERVKRLARSGADKAIIQGIQDQYDQYQSSKEQVIERAAAAGGKNSLKLDQEVLSQFFSLLELCQHYMDTQQKRIQEEQAASGLHAQQLRIISVTTMSLAIFLGCLLAAILMTQILGPVRRLAMETDRSGGSARPGDEVVALGHQVRTLIKDMEKFALVGKLAAGVAHSIRNPLTSVKMRLFSMERDLELSSMHKEDFEVISQEIRHIDTIVRNFLEFSRPPKLTMQPASPSDIVDNALQLMRHRLESCNVTVKVNRKKHLPLVLADPEQLKEVLVNLMVNACEAMPHGGAITIHERESSEGSGSRSAVLEVSDNGPGIPHSIQDKVFQPFFSTKEEGTGLGLAIAARIVNEHGGRLDLRSKEGKGTTFLINLPLISEVTTAKEDHEHNTAG